MPDVGRMLSAVGLAAVDVTLRMQMRRLVRSTGNPVLWSGTAVDPRSPVAGAEERRYRRRDIHDNRRFLEARIVSSLCAPSSDHLPPLRAVADKATLVAQWNPAQGWHQPQPWLGFLRTPEFKDIPTRVILACAGTMAAGTAAGVSSARWDTRWCGCNP